MSRSKAIIILEKKKDKIKQEYCYIFFLNFNIEEIKKAPLK